MAETRTREPVVESFGILGKLWLAFLAALIVAGLGAWLYQLQHGLVVTGMRNIFSWGLYIMTFVLFVGLSAGGLIISSTPKFFHSDQYEEISRLGVLLSLACITVAGLLILPDLGRVERIYQFFTTPDLRSPMVWDFAIVVVYGLISTWYLWLLTRRDLAAKGSALAFGVEDSAKGRARDRRLSFWTASIAIPAAVLLHSITGWIFATQVGRGDWFSPLVAPVFIAKALVSGLALLLITAILVDRFTDFELPEAYLSGLGKILGIFLAVHVVYLLGAERLPEAWAHHFEFWSISSGFLIGETTFFWLWTVVGGAIPLAILMVPSLRTKVSAVLLASALAVMGVLFEGVRLIFIGYDRVNIDAAPGIPVGEYPGFGGSIWATVGVYAPTVIEIGVTLGLVALGALILTLGIRFLPLQASTEAAVTDGGTER